MKWIVGLSALSLSVTLAAPKAAEVEYTSQFRLQNCTFSYSGSNPYFSLRTGHRQLLEGEEDGATVTVEQEVLNLTRVVSFTLPSGRTLSVRTRVVRETEWEDGELVEISRNFFARCKETNDVFYFGEEVDNYDEGEIVSHSGTWLAGRQDALPGLIMPGTFLLGSRYFQELAPGVALDRAEHTAMGLTVTVPAGTFHNCVEVIDTNALDPKGAGDVKMYCPGVGIVADGPAQLVEVED